MRPGRRKLFNRAAQQVFLEWFAATCNVSLSAEKAGFNYKTVLRHRMTDPHFAEGWQRAVEQAYARLEAKQLETKAKEGRIGIEGDLDAPEMEDIDPEQAARLLALHRREAKHPELVRRQGRRPTVATNAEVKAALEKRLKAFHARERARLGAKDPPRDGASGRIVPQTILDHAGHGQPDAGDRPAQPDGGGGYEPGTQIGSDAPSSAPSPLHRPSDGSPPRPGEDLE